jgi:hypothetical protein
VYTADGKKDFTKKGQLGDALLKATALRSGQYVEVRTQHAAAPAVKPNML